MRVFTTTRKGIYNGIDLGDGVFQTSRADEIARVRKISGYGTSIKEFELMADGELEEVDYATGEIPVVPELESEPESKPEPEPVPEPSKKKKG